MSAIAINKRRKTFLFQIPENEEKCFKLKQMVPLIIKN